MVAELVCRPIGYLETPWKRREDCPRNGRAPVPPPECRAVVDEAYRAGLASLDGFSHLILLYWLDRPRDGSRELVFTPPFDDSPRGIFATRAPHRPNPIGLSVVRLLGMEGGILRVHYLDCLDGTPLLDIKPYLARSDSEPDATMGWLAARQERKAGS